MLCFSVATVTPAPRVLPTGQSPALKASLVAPSATCGSWATSRGHRRRDCRLEPYCSNTVSTAAVRRVSWKRSSDNKGKLVVAAASSPPSAEGGSAVDSGSSAGSSSSALEVMEKPMYGGARGGVPFPCDQDSKQLLSSSPAGAYTTMRTVGRTSIFELGFHIARLSESAKLMMQENGAGILDSHAVLLDPATLRPLVLESVLAAVRQFEELNPKLGPEHDELRPTVLLTWKPDGTFEILSHVSALPPRPQSPVLVQVAGAPRSNAAAKNSEWVRQRMDLEKSAPPGCNEVLLMDSEGFILEGLSSNFFTFQDGAIYTAPEGILLGTVREMVLKVAAMEGVPVVMQPPNINDLGKWEGLFVTSTSRLMLCADRVAVEGEAELKVFESSPVLSRLEQLVMEEIASCSEQYDFSGF